jgi:hypothetical protein
MPTYLVESYTADRHDALTDARDQGGQGRRAGPLHPPPAHDLPPSEETMFHVFEAASWKELGHAAQLAGLPYERIAEVVEAAGGPDGPFEPEGGAPWEGSAY